MSQKNELSTNNLFSTFLRPQFFVFSLSVIFSQIATNMLNIVLIVLTYKLTHSNFAVSILVMTFLLPQVFLSFLGGIIADAKNKRKILIFGNLARAIILLLFFFVNNSLAFIYVFELVIAIVTQFYVPAESPIIPYIVKKNQLFSANAIFGVCLFGSILLGYVGAGPAMRFFGDSGAFLFMSLLFAIACLCVLIMPDVSPKSRKLRTEKTFYANFYHLVKLVINELRDVIKIIRMKKEVASALLFLSLSQVIILVLATIIPDYAIKMLHIGAEDISLYIFAPAALGMILASIVIGSKFVKSNKQNLITIGILLSCLVLSLFATIDLQNHVNLIFLTFIITFAAGVANSFIFVPAQTIVQTSVENAHLSKVYGLLFGGIGVLAFLPIILTGVFADFLGVRWVLLGIAFLLLLVGIFKISLRNKSF